MFVQFERAGSNALKSRLHIQIDNFLKKRLVLKNRIDIKKQLDPADQAIYYSAWYYAAVHILVTISAYQSREAISNRLQIPLDKVSQILEFLTAVGLLVLDKGIYKAGVSRIFLGSDSGMISKHHCNWRMRAIHSLDQGILTDLHFSTIVSLSKKDIPIIKETIIKKIEEVRTIVKNSVDEEELYCFNSDFFVI